MQSLSWQLTCLHFTEFVSVDPHLSREATLGTQWLDWEFSLMVWVTCGMKQFGRQLWFFFFFLISKNAISYWACSKVWCIMGFSPWKMIPSISPGVWDVVAVAPQMEVVAQTSESCCNSRCGWQVAGGAGERWILRAISPEAYWHHHVADIRPSSYRGAATVLIPCSW